MGRTSLVVMSLQLCRAEIFLISVSEAQGKALSCSVRKIERRYVKSGYSGYESPE